MCDFVMTGQPMSREELLSFEVEKEMYDVGNLNELTELMQLIGSFIDGCDQVLVNSETIFHKDFSDEEERVKLVYTTSAMLKPYFDRPENLLTISINMHSGYQGYVFQVLFDKTKINARTRGIKSPFYIKQILPSGKI